MRRTLGRLRRIRPAQWAAILAALSLMLVALFTSTLWADYINITIDAVCTEWTSNEYILTDPNEADIPDEYDIGDVYASLNTNGTMHAVHYDTIANLYINSGASTQIWYDIDADSTTGYPIGGIGAERRVLWSMDTDSCEVARWDSGTNQWVLVDNDCNGEPSGIGQKTTTCVEIGADTLDLGIDSTDTLAICMLFENADFAGPPDDTVCFVYDLPTAVNLAYFTATWNGDEVLVKWETALEVDTVGFNLWRSTAPNGNYVRVNHSLIPSATPGGTSGSSYSYTDSSVVQGMTYYYKLEELEIGGGTKWYGPISTGSAEYIGGGSKSTCR